MMSDKHYFGKVCIDHPENNGLRLISNSDCVACKKQRDKQYRELHKAKKALADKKWYSLNKEYRAEYRKQYHSVNKDKELKQHKVWYAENKSVRIENNVVRTRLIGGQAIAKAHQKEIRKIYANCPKGFHVDHIIPLRGNSVSGLHVPWNMQYLPAALNLAKGNKLTTC